MILSYYLGKGVAGADRNIRERYIVIWHILYRPNALLMGVGCGNDGYWRVYIPIHYLLYMQLCQQSRGI